MYKKNSRKNKKCATKKKRLQRNLQQAQHEGRGRAVESEKNCYKWQLATPFDGGKEHTEGGGQKKSNTHT